MNTTTSDLTRVIKAIKQCAKTMRSIEAVFDEMDCTTLRDTSESIAKEITVLAKNTELLDLMQGLLNPDKDSEEF